jgi:hypothetical protein
MSCGSDLPVPGRCSIVDADSPKQLDRTLVRISLLDKIYYSVDMADKDVAAYEWIHSALHLRLHTRSSGQARRFEFLPRKTDHLSRKHNKMHNKEMLPPNTAEPGRSAKAYRKWAVFPKESRLG